MGLMAFQSAPVMAGEDHACLTEAIYFEAGAKGAAGRAAVGHTILNRVAHPEFPDTICGVIKQGEAEKKCQFSYRCDGIAEVYDYPDQLKLAENSAQAILSGDATDPTGGAIYFHAESIPPGWFGTLERLGAFGGNIFYK